MMQATLWVLYKICIVQTYLWLLGFWGNCLAWHSGCWSHCTFAWVHVHTQKWSTPLYSECWEQSLLSCGYYGFCHRPCIGCVDFLCSLTCTFTIVLFYLKCILYSFLLLCPDDDFDGSMDDALDMKGLSKRDMHTLNEQRRRDSIKVSNFLHTCTCTRVIHSWHVLELYSIEMLLWIVFFFLR